MGGLPKLQSIKTMRVNISESDGGAPPSPLDVTLAFPDRMHIDIQTEQGSLTIVATPDEAFMSMAGMGSRSMPPAQKNEMLTQLHHDLVYVAQHVDDPAFTFTAAGTEKIGDTETAILDIGGAIPWVRWYIDPKTESTLSPPEKYLAIWEQSVPFLRARPILPTGAPSTALPCPTSTRTSRMARKPATRNLRRSN